MAKVSFLMKVIYSILFTYFSLFSLADESSLSDKQWHLKNTGQSISRRTGKYQNTDIKGLAGVDINLDEQYDLVNNIKVAIFDSGIDINHPGLLSKLWKDPTCQRDSHECHGINLINNNFNVTDEIGHGTHIAGIIAGDSFKGIRGIIGKNIDLMPVKIKKNKFDSFFIRKRLVSDQIASGIKYAVDKGVKVINMSFGLPKILETPNLLKAFKYAHSKNVLIVAAAGNNGKDQPVFPCNYHHVLCVGSIDNTGKKLVSSNFGHVVDIYAPGEYIYSTFPTNMESRIARVGGVDIKTGTSYAAPIVASLATILYSINPSANDLSIREIILSSSKNINGLKVVDFKTTIKNYKKFLKEKKSLFHTNIKRISEQTVVDGIVKFSIDVESVGVISSPDISIKSLNDVKFSVVGSQKLNERNTRFLISAKVNDLNINSKQNFHLNISDSVYPISINLSKYVESKIKKPVEKTFVKEVFQRSKILNNSLLVPVKEYLVDAKSSEFFLKDEKNQKLTLYTENKTVFKKLILNFKTKTIVSAVIKADINLDGKMDYFIYGTDTKKLNYKFLFFNEEGKPLFEKYSEWYLRANNFGALNFNRGKLNFQFLKHKNFLGEVLVPVVLRTYEIDQSANSTDPINRISTGQKLRPYYFSPFVSDKKVMLEIKTLEDFSFIERMRSEFDLNFFDEIVVNNIIPQDKEEFLQGKVSLIYNLGENASKESYKVEFSNTNDYKITYFVKKFLQGNNILRHRMIGKNIYNDRLSFSKRYQRNVVRSFDNITEKSIFFRSTSWDDPINAVIDSFDNDKTFASTSFIESRYHIYADYQSSGQRVMSKFPINRESSFPGMSFSSSFKPVMIASDGAIFMDTQSVFGQSVGVLRLDENQEISLKIKDNYFVRDDCASLGVFEIGLKSKLYFHCADNKKSWIEILEL